jgi:hypothetical protein
MEKPKLYVSFAGLPGNVPETAAMTIVLSASGRL